MKKIFISLCIGSLLLTGCAKQYESIQAAEAKTIMEEQTDYLILDVRTKEEYNTGHIPKALCIPNETIDKDIEKTLRDKDQLILVYCRSGNRSKQASKKLSKMGYTQIKEFGGIQSWPYEIVK